jgi:hypothetical protein
MLTQTKKRIQELDALADEVLTLPTAEYGSSGLPDALNKLKSAFLEANALLHALEYEILSRESPVKTELSLEVAATELDTAQDLLDKAKGAEVFIRASGVIARVALERHLFTVADANQVAIAKNPPNKKHADVEDVLQSLHKQGVINAIQKYQFDSLFKLANNCAHPKEAVNEEDMQTLLWEGKRLAEVVV